MRLAPHILLTLICLLLAIPAHAVLDFGTLKATPAMVESITLAEGAVVPVFFGESAQLVAKTCPEGQTVTWAIQPEGDSKAQATIDSSGLITAGQESESGLVRVSASLQGSAPKEALIYIGCQSCSGSQCEVIPGNGFVQIGSIDIRLSLGKAENGMPAGDLLLKANEPLAILSTPEALELSTLSKNVKAIYREKQLRQLITPQSFIHIAQLSPFDYQIFYYHLSDQGPMEDGLYRVDPMAIPIAVWQIQNPNESLDNVNNLLITEMRGNGENIYEYSYDEQEKTWQLSSGDGLRLESRKEYIDADNSRVVRTTISGQDGRPVSVTEKVFHEFAWGEESIREITDPDGARLTTITNYSKEKDPGYSKVRSRIQPDGSWLRYHYDKEGRVVKKASSCLDADIDSPDDQVRLVVNDYNPVDRSDSNLKRDRHRPRVVTEKIKGIVVSKTFHLFKTAANGERTTITEQCATQDSSYGDPDNLRSISTTHPVGIKGPEAGKEKSSLSSSKQLTSYFYERGTFEPSMEPGKSVFTPGKGKAIKKTVVQGTEKHPKGIPSQTTKTTSITDWLGNEVMDETFVKTEEGYERIDWTFRTYNRVGRLLETLHSNQTRTENSWSCCGKASTTDLNGITTRQVQDSLKRVSAEINETTGIVTEFAYDAAGRRTGSVSKNGNLSLSQSSLYDMAGRLEENIDQAGLTTGYFYEKNRTTVIRPGGGAEISKTYKDGRIHSITGSSVVARYYEYGIYPDGSQWTKVYIGKKNSPRWEKVSRDFFGRVVLIERPGFKTIESTRNYYNKIGQIVRTTSPSQADTIYVYDELGNQILAGLDVDSNSQLDLASKDRIQQNQGRYIKIDDNWWQQSRHSVLAQENSAKENTVSTSLRRLSGWDGRVISETITRDIHGNETISTESLDRHNRTQIRKTQYPDSTINAELVFINNRLVSSRGKTGVEKVFSHDELGRRISVTDKRTGVSITHYNDKGQVDFLEDAAGNRTGFIYDPETGQKVAEINALNKATRYVYNLRGQLTHTWGDVPYPVEYLYNDYGEKVTMRTFRGGEDWQEEEWPERTGTPDETHWQLQETTGLLLAKTDAKGNSAAYTYSPGGRLDNRIWARGISTTYTYSPGTGELDTIDYSDSTPDISFKYDRLGRKIQVNDDLGVHLFKYNDKLQLEQEEITGKVISSLNRKYDDLGRSSGFDLGQEYAVNYSYDAVGRFDTIDWQVAGKTGHVDYGYLEDSDLLAGLSFDEKITVAYEYESQRDLRTSVTNKAGDKLISRYEYQYDRLGRRTNVTTSGSAFTKQGFTLYGYNDRNELQSSSRFAGNDLSDQARPVSDQERFYQYDPIGNRTKAHEAEKRINYVSNELNQYTSVSGPQTAKHEYDVDGNLTELKKDTTTTRYIYNGENRLIVVEPRNPVVGDTKSEFVYDYQGRRRVKKVSIYQAGKWQQDTERSFLYDGWNLIAELDENSKTAINYVWGLDLSQSLQDAGGIGGLLARVDQAVDKTHFYLYDSNGNVGQLVDTGDGALAASYEYDPYGNIIASIGSYATENPFRFSTKYFDSETGLIDYGLRYYFSALGKWLNRDPIGEEGGLNLYGFVLNDPVNFVDPWGLIPKCKYKNVDSPWKNFTGETRPQNDIIKIRSKVFPPSPFSKPGNKTINYLSIYKIVIYEIEWLEGEYELKQARLWVCYDECGNKVYEGWAPSAVLGTGWEKIEGSERITGKRFLPNYDWELGL